MISKAHRSEYNGPGARLKKLESQESFGKRENDQASRLINAGLLSISLGGRCSAMAIILSQPPTVKTCTRAPVQLESSAKPTYQVFLWYAYRPCSSLDAPTSFKPSCRYDFHSVVSFHCKYNLWVTLRPNGFWRQIWNWHKIPHRPASRYHIESFLPALSV